MAQVTSGYCYSGYSMDSRYYVYWERTGTWNDSTCGSNINWYVYLDNHNWWYNNALKIYPVYINGVCVYNGGTFSNKTTSGAILLASGTTKIQHNNDGMKKFNINFTGWFYSSTNVSGSDDFELVTIPRASSFGTVSGVTMGSDMTININRNSSNFTHSLWYSFGSKTWQAIGSGIGTSKTFTIPLSLASEIPNDTYGTMTLILRTYNGSTQVGSDKTVAYRVHVPDIESTKPSISTIGVSEATSGLAAQFAAYVQYKSTLKVSVTAVGSYGATIKSYSTKVGNSTYSGSSFTTGTMNSSGLISVTTIVTDSRGRQNTKSISVSVTQYYDPKAITLEAARCTSDGTLNDEGTYVKLTYKYDIASVGSKNTKSAKIQYLNGSTWTDLVTHSAYTGNSSVTPTSKTFSVDSGWQFRLVVSDYFSTQYNYADISTGFTLMNFNADGTGVAFGKVSERSNAVEIDLETHLFKPVSLGNYTNQSTVPQGGIKVHDLRNATPVPGMFGDKRVNFYFVQPPGKDWHTVMSVSGWKAQSQDYATHELMFNATDYETGALLHREGRAGSWGTLKTILDSSNYSDYAFPKSGGSIQYANTSGMSWPLTLHQTGNSNSTGWGPGIKFRNASDSSSKWAGIGGIAYSKYANENGLVFYASATDTARLRTDRFVPTANGTTHLGDSSHRWASVYTNSIVLNGTDMMTQNVLWSSSGSYMNGSQSATLSQAVSSQRNGIVLVWSDYGTTGNDWDFYCNFVPKQFVASKPGKMLSVGVMSTTGFGTVGTKAVYVSDTVITGHADNANGTQSSGSTITYKNNKWVLRMVIGV